MYSLTSTEEGTESQVSIVTPPSSDEERCRPGVTLENILESKWDTVKYRISQNQLRKAFAKKLCNIIILLSSRILVHTTCRWFPEDYAIFELMLTDFLSYNDRMQTDLTSEHSEETFLVCTMNHSFLHPPLISWVT